MSPASPTVYSTSCFASAAACSSRAQAAIYAHEHPDQINGAALFIHIGQRVATAIFKVIARAQDEEIIAITYVLA